VTTRTGTGSAPAIRPRGRHLAGGRDSVLWLAAVAAAFTAAVLLLTPLRMSLAWDETVYVSQIGRHAPMLWSSERSRGMPLLVAPVTLLTSSAFAIRCYLAVLAGAGMFLALLAWRGLRPAWVLALAGLAFGSLWIAQDQASQVYPNFWVALAGLAAAGLVLRIVTGVARSRWALAALAAVAAAASLMRPTDSVFIFAPLLAAAAVVARRRSVAVIASAAAGLVVGLGEWAAEAYLYFGNPVARLHAESHAVGGSHFSAIDSLRILSGGVASSVPGFPSIAGWSRPWLLLWWLAFAGFAVAGVYAASRAHGWVVAAIPAVCAICIYIQYTLPARDNPRYLLPAWALLAIPAADGIAWLAAARTGWKRPAAISLAAVFVVAEIVTQHVVLTSQVRAAEAGASSSDRVAAALRRLGVRPPCRIASSRPHLVSASEPAAFQVGCEFSWNSRLPAMPGQSAVVLVLGASRPPGRASGWPARRIGDGIVAYIQPLRSPAPGAQSG
jgi:hypothetical protein